MQTKRKLFVAGLLLMFLPLMLNAQQPKLIKVSEFSVSHIPTIEERVFLVHSILDQGYFCFSHANVPNTIDVYVSSDASDELSDFDFFFDNVLYEQLNEFSYLGKDERGELFVEWRQGINDEVFKVLYEDFTRGVRTDNATCETAAPFCTDIGLYDFPAGVNSGSPCGSTYNASCSEPYKCSGTPGQSTNCLSTAPNPAFYYLLIDEPGNLNIYMHSTPQVDIDFDCWGPFHDINTACDLLSCSNIVDCSYSTSATEHCHINNAQTGQFYILLITNYSNQPCNISFENVGTGTTDCSILPPLVSGGGPYCVGETIQLTAQNQAGASFSWTGPNGFSSNQQNPTIPNCTLEMAGVYTCTITIGEESSSAETEYVQVNAMPSASFTFTEVCLGEATQFNSTATTNPTGQDISSYDWDFGDGETGRGQSISHTYAEAGSYQVTHHVATGSGVCNDEITETVVVYAIPVGTASAEPASVMYGGSSTITVEVEPAGNYSFHWEPANMVTNPNSQTTQTVGIEDTQVFTVTITSLDGGCTSTAQVAVAMAGSNMSATVSADNTTLCEGEATSLHALPIAGTGEYQYSWTPTNTLSNPTSQNPVATPPVGSTTYTCVIQDGLTTQEVSITITVNPNKEHDIYEAICENGTYDFYGQILSAEGVYHHTLETSLGCDSTLHLHLTLNTLDETFPPDIVTCNEYFWDPEGHEIVYTDHEDLVYSESNTYHRTYLNHLGCDSLVTLRMEFQYTPTPTEIYPLDPDNTAPHWVVTATEFQIQSYDFHLWDTNPHCYWDTVTWNFAEPIDWVLEPFGDRGTSCKMYVLDQVNDTIWLEAHAYNRCTSGEGIVQRYWFVCSFYGIDENDVSTGPVDFNVVPNPNNGQMQLLFENLDGKAEVKVYDMRGLLIDSFETYDSSGRFGCPYDMKVNANGIYFFVVTTKEGTLSKKVVIQR